MMKFLARIWLDYLKPFWSKIRWNKQRKVVAEECKETVKTIAEIRAMCSKVYSCFEWTMDDISELFDSYRPTEYLYNTYLGEKAKGKKWQDDCDGYHTVIYHILIQNGFDAVLFTIATKPFTKSHTMCLFKADGKMYLVNYTSVREYESGNIQAIVDDYNKRNKLEPEHYWNTQKYDYAGKVFYSVNFEENDYGQRGFETTSFGGDNAE